MKNIVILGSTGSIGTSALEVIRGLNSFKVLGLSGNKNVDLIFEQIKEFKPKYVSIGCKDGFERLKKEFPEVIFYFGDEGLKK